MAEPSKRVIVDGVNFSQIVSFPRILSAITAAMQPPRLLIALFAVLLLVSGGRLWDAFTTPRVHPAGLTAGEMTVDEQAHAQRVLRSAVQRYIPEADQPEGEVAAWPFLDARKVMRDVQRGYQQKRDPEAGLDQLRRQDEAFLSTLRSIDEVRPKGTFEGLAMHLRNSLNHIAQGVIYLQPRDVFSGFGDAFLGAPLALWQGHKLFALIYGVFFLLVMAISGGALSRMAACEIAGHQRLRVIEAWQFATLNWPRLVLAPVFPLVLAALFALLLILFGVLMTVPVLDVIGGLLYIIALGLGFVITFLLLGYAVGFAFFIPAVACENCDAADAQQRAYAYVLTRPWHLIGYGLTGVIGLALGYALVAFFAATLLNLTATFVGSLTGNTAMAAAGGFSTFDLTSHIPTEFHPAWHNAAAAGLISLWQTLIIALVAAYVVSYIFSAATMVYLLMRKVCDGQDIEEIWVPGLVPGTLTPLPRTRVESARQATAATIRPRDTADDHDESESENAESADEDDDGNDKKKGESKQESSG